MNVFKKKAKAKDDSYMIPPAQPIDPTPPSKISRSLKRKQKQVVEPKVEVDLTTVLPETNDFRTSLLMPGLSARFSMLREQDDPNTKLGKASDDSVLFPKRASRLNLFAHNPLTEISETESIRLPYRPPFAETERSLSFSEGGSYANDDSNNVLNRSRPTEGNNLFGARQKMYRVPTATSSNRELGTETAPMAVGKHLYQKDIASSTYQQYRAKVREESRERPLSSETEEHENSSVVNTPSTGFSKSRGTASSTASGPSNRRTSTAATSVASDSPAQRQSNMSSGFNTRINASDYGSEESLLKRNFSSDSRKGFPFNENVNQPPLPSSPITNRALPQSRSATNLMDKFGRENGPFSASTPRALSPPPTSQNQGLASLDFGLKQPSHHPRKYQTGAFANEGNESDVYNQSLQPNDRGKATAMGLFNRPRQQFDEQQFQQRQLQMHGGPMSPSYADHPANRAVAEQHETSATRPRSPSSPSIKSSFNGQESSNVSVAARSRAQSAASAHATQINSHVEAFIKRQNDEYSALQATKGVQLSLQPQAANPVRSLADQPASRGTFFDTFDGSDEDEADLDSPMLGRYEPPPRLAPMEVHPALRDNSQAFIFGDQIPAPLKTARPGSIASVDTSSPSVIHDTPDTSDSLHQSSPRKATDSPTIGPTTGLGLSGMIRTHLRNDSDRSSFMPPPSPLISQHLEPGPDAFRQREASIASTARTINPPESTHSDPWEFDNAHRNHRGPADYTPADTIPTMSQKAQQILGQAISHRNQATSKAQQILGSDAPDPSDEHNGPRPWHSDVVQGHQRGESTETQKEFGNELAERARRIQEGFKGGVEVEKRPRSPGPQRGDRQNPAAHALHALRQKSSKTSLVPRSNEPQPKAMKMLGMGNNTPRMDMPGRSPNMGARGDYHFDQAYDDNGGQYTPRQRPAEFEPPNGRRTPAYGRPPPPMHMNGSHEDFERSRQRTATPTSGRPPPRNRAESEAGERSRSRMGRDREEPPYHQAEYGRHGPHQRPPPHWDQRRPRGPPPVHPHGPPTEYRDYERSSSSMSNRRPSNPRPPPSGYFDSRSATPTMGSTPTLGSGPMPTGVPRPSPRPPFPHSPMSPFTPAMSPGLSGPQSAVVSALPSPVVQMHPPPTGRSTPVENRTTIAAARKKSVTKGMISEPTFISSTSSVPLVGLPISPRPGQIATPPVPAMNPRRRGNTMSEKPDAFPSPRMTGSPMFAESANQSPYVEQQRAPPRQRNRLRKISSEGGGMAARARNQAIMAEFGREKLRSPAVQVFPNRSATSLGLHQDGGMF